jgi:isopenicillin-N N-acyltransferase like protein
VLRVVHAEGDAAARGRKIGSELGDLIDRSLAFYREYFAELGIQDLRTAVHPYRQAAERSFPGHVATIRAMANAAEVAEAELFAVNACEELKEVAVPAERCSTFTAVSPGVTLLGHNEQWLAGDAENVAVVVEQPAEGITVLSPTVATCLAAVGMNGHGGAQGIDSLTARDEQIGVPRVLVSRHSLEAAGREDAVSRAGVEGRAGGYGHVFAFRGGEAFTIETSATRLALLDGPGAHTNHYLDRDLAELGDEPSAGSRSRLERLLQLLEDESPLTREDAMAILRDHDSSPQAICKHAASPEESTIIFSMVCELESRRMWVAPGCPCETHYEEVPVSL